MVGLGWLPQNGQTAWKFGSLSLFWDPLRPLRDCNVSEGVEHGRCQGLTFGERMVFQNLRTSWEIRRYPTWFPKSNKRSRLRPKFEVQIPPSFPQNARWNQNHLYFYRSNHKKDCSDQGPAKSDNLIEFDSHRVFFTVWVACFGTFLGPLPLGGEILAEHSTSDENRGSGIWIVTVSGTWADQSKPLIIQA